MRTRTRFGLYAIVVSVFSSLFHASHTYVFETADLAAMQFLGTELVVRNLHRLGWLRGISPVAIAALLWVGGVGVLFGTEGVSRLGVFGAFALVAVLLEGILFFRAKQTALLNDFRLRLVYRRYVLTLGLFLIAWAGWVVDYRGYFCQPDQHFLSGHGFWHLMNAGCFLTLSRFYEGVSALAPVRPPR
jgi:hypothetical protein